MDSGLRIRDGDLIAGFVKGLSVIETFDQQRHKLSIADVARLTGLERASARRCLLTLVHGGYAEFDGKFFRLTPRVLKLGYAYLSSTPLPGIIQPYLEQLSEAIHESSSASILDASEIVYVARSAQRRVMLIGLNVGSRLPAYCASMGRVLLAALPEDQARRRLEATKREKLTPKTLTGIGDLMKELGRVRSQGYALMDEELEIGLRSIAVPIFDSRGSVVAAANVGVQASRMSSEMLISDVLPRLLTLQGELRKLLG